MMGASTRKGNVVKVLDLIKLVVKVYRDHGDIDVISPLFGEKDINASVCWSIGDPRSSEGQQYLDLDQEPMEHWPSRKVLRIS